MADNAAAALDTRQPDLGQELLADLLRSGHRVVVTVHGNSMLRTIKHGEQVLIAPLGQARPRRGDIVYLQRADASYVLHRVLRVFADGRVQTHGDAHWRLDDAIGAQVVLGQMRAASRPRYARLRAIGTRIHCWVRLAESWRGYRRERRKNHMKIGPVSRLEE